jgi:hypothetical protein
MSSLYYLCPFFLYIVFQVLNHLSRCPYFVSVAFRYICQCVPFLSMHREYLKS